MCLTNIKETEFIDIPRIAYKVIWHDKDVEYTGPFSPEPIVRGEWRIPEDAIDHVRTKEYREQDGECVPSQASLEDGIPAMKCNPRSRMRLSYEEYGPCYHVFWSQENAGSYVAAVLKDFGSMDKRMATKIRIELVKVKGEIRTGILGQGVPGGGLTAATATQIKFENNA